MYTSFLSNTAFFLQAAANAHKKPCTAAPQAVQQRGPSQAAGKCRPVGTAKSHALRDQLPILGLFIATNV